MRVLRYVAALFILLAGAFGSYLLWDTRPRSIPAVPEAETWPVAVRTVDPGPVAPTLNLFGRLESPQLARLSAAVSADVVDVFTEEGALVQIGQTLIVLDGQDATLHLRQRDAEVADLEAQLEIEQERRRTDEHTLRLERQLLALTKSSVKRAQDLATRNLGSLSQLDLSRQDETRQEIALENRRSSLRDHGARVAQLNARLAKSKALRDQAALDLQRTTIKAPFAGRITHVPVSPGDRVRAGDPLVNLFSQDKVELRAQIPSRQFPLIRASLMREKRLQGTVRVDGEQLAVELHRLSGQANAGQGGIDGLFRLRAVPGWLRLGRTLELSLTLDEVEDAISIALGAIYGQNRVYKVVGERMVGVEVKRLGERRTPGGGAEILVRSADLEAGDRIVITQLPNATDGLRVRALR